MQTSYSKAYNYLTHMLIILSQLCSADYVVSICFNLASDCILCKLCISLLNWACCIDRINVLAQATASR